MELLHCNSQYIIYRSRFKASMVRIELTLQIYGLAKAMDTKLRRSMFRHT
jgi:hypothetical protein